MKKLMLLAFAGLFLSNALVEAGCKGGSCSRSPRTTMARNNHNNKAVSGKKAVIKSAAVRTAAKTKGKVQAKYIALRNCKSGTCKRK